MAEAAAALCVTGPVIRRAIEKKRLRGKIVEGGRRRAYYIIDRDDLTRAVTEMRIAREISGGLVGRLEMARLLDVGANGVLSLAAAGQLRRIPTITYDMFARSDAERILEAFEQAYTKRSAASEPFRRREALLPALSFARACGRHGLARTVRAVFDERLWPVALDTRATGLSRFLFDTNEAKTLRVAMPRNPEVPFDEKGYADMPSIRRALGNCGNMTVIMIVDRGLLRNDLAPTTATPRSRKQRRYRVSLASLDAFRAEYATTGMLANELGIHPLTLRRHLRQAEVAPVVSADGTGHVNAVWRRSDTKPVLPLSPVAIAVVRTT